jgi:hypothetical protein
MSRAGASSPGRRVPDPQGVAEVQLCPPALLLRRQHAAGLSRPPSVLAGPRLVTTGPCAACSAEPTRGRAGDSRPDGVSRWMQFGVQCSVGAPSQGSVVLVPAAGAAVAPGVVPAVGCSVAVDVLRRHSGSGGEGRNAFGRSCIFRGWGGRGHEKSWECSWAPPASRRHP